MKDAWPRVIRIAILALVVRLALMFVRGDYIVFDEGYYLLLARSLRAGALGVERAQYEAARAERAFHHCEPDHRLVARSLEQRWEATTWKRISRPCLSMRLDVQE